MATRRAASRRGSRLASSASRQTRPAEGRSVPAASFRIVDLPAPLGPSSPTISPGATRSETASSARARRYAKLTAANSSAGLPIVRLLTFGLPLVASPGGAQQRQEERSADQRRQRAQRQHGRCDDRTRQQIRQRDEDRAAQRRGRNQ